MADGGLIAARALMFVALLMVAGLPIYFTIAGRGIAVPRRLPIALSILALVSATASMWWAVASVSAMTAQPLGTLDRDTLNAVLSATPLGTVLEIRLALLAGVILIAFAPIGRSRLYLASVAGGAALATCAWSGHAGATESALGSGHRVADVLHLLAAGTWFGALASLLTALSAQDRPPDLEQRLAGFATIGTVIVAVLLVSGIFNTLAIAGWPLSTELLSSRWSGLLAIKLALFITMLALAGLNRWRLTPALAASKTSTARNLRLSLVFETIAGIAIIALVSVIGTLDPSG